MKKRENTVISVITSYIPTLISNTKSLLNHKLSQKISGHTRGDPQKPHPQNPNPIHHPRTTRSRIPPHCCSLAPAMARAGVSTAPLSRLHSLPPPRPALLHHYQQPHVVLRPQRRAPSTAAAALPTAADLTPLSLPAAAAAAAALAAAVSLSDPERRRRAQAEAAGGGDKEAVRAYFNSTGFERWRKIYGSATEGVNRVQLDIREGHAQTVAKALAMLRDSPLELAGATVCDAGCGTGSLSIPLAAEGADVLASDISAAMVSEAQRQAQAAQPEGSQFRMPAAASSAAGKVGRGEGRRSREVGRRRNRGGERRGGWSGWGGSH